MRRFGLVAGLALVLAPAAYAGHNPNHAPNPAQTCRALQAEDQQAFQELFPTFGACVRTVAQARKGQQNPRAATNPARTCRALRAEDQQAFQELFPTFGKCVSTVAKTRGQGGTP